MGDTVFIDIVNEMMLGNFPLLTSDLGDRTELPFSQDQHLSITQKGLDVLSAKAHWLETHTIDKWLGGVHLSKENVWLWNSETKEIERG